MFVSLGIRPVIKRNAGFKLQFLGFMVPVPSQKSSCADYDDDENNYCFPHVGVSLIQDTS